MTLWSIPGKGGSIRLRVAPWAFDYGHYKPQNPGFKIIPHGNVEIAPYHILRAERLMGSLFVEVWNQRQGVVG